MNSIKNWRADQQGRAVTPASSYIQPSCTFCSTARRLMP